MSQLWPFFFGTHLYLQSVELKSTEIVPPDHLLLDSAPNLGPLISRWEVNKFGNCRYKGFRISEVQKLLFQQFLNLPSSQQDLSGPILGDLSNNRRSGGSTVVRYIFCNQDLYRLWSVKLSNQTTLQPVEVAVQNCPVYFDCYFITRVL